MKYISLGCCCETSFVIDRLCCGGERFPFDWLSIHDFNDVIRSIETDFKNFKITSPVEVQWKSTYNNDVMSFPQIGDYKMHVIHKLDQETLDRRVQRFRKTMKGDEHITFILKTHIFDFSCAHPYTPFMAKESVERLEKAIQLHRKERYTIIVVNESVYPTQTHSWEDVDRKTKVLITQIIGQPHKGSERGMVVVPCDYKNSNKCIDQWKKILGK